MANIIVPIKEVQLIIDLRLEQEVEKTRKKLLALALEKYSFTERKIKWQLPFPKIVYIHYSEEELIAKYKNTSGCCFTTAFEKSLKLAKIKSDLNNLKNIKILSESGMEEMILNTYQYQLLFK